MGMTDLTASELWPSKTMERYTTISYKQYWLLWHAHKWKDYLQHVRKLRLMG